MSRTATIRFLGVNWTAHYDYEPAQHGGRVDPSWDESWSLTKLERPGTVIDASELRETDRLDIEADIAADCAVEPDESMHRNGWAAA